jgi:hypothetical protein
LIAHLEQKRFPESHYGLGRGHVTSLEIYSAAEIQLSAAIQLFCARRGIFAAAELAFQALLTSRIKCVRVVSRSKSHK